MKESRLRNLVRQEIKNKLDKVAEGKDPFVPTYGKGDVVHDCPKHVQETITGKRGKVTGHTLNESGAVNFVDVDFGTGKIFENIPTKKLKILEMQEHAHNIKEEPVTGAGEEDVVTETGDKCDCADVHPGISHRAYDSQQLAEDLKVKARKDNEMGSSLGYKLTQPQHKKMLAFLKKNKSNSDVKQLLSTLKDKYSDSVSITLDNRPFFVYASYGMLRIGSGGKVSQWNDGMKKALTKYIGESVLYEKVTPSQVSKAFDNVAKVSLELIKNLESYKKAKSSGNEAGIKKYKKMAGDLTKKKKAAEVNAEKMIQALDKDAKLVMTEAPMDTRFSKEFERDCKVLLTHIKHEMKNREKLQKFGNKLRACEKRITDAMEVPKLLSQIVGTNEGRISEAKTRLDEKFASSKLAKAFAPLSRNRWNGGRDFLNQMAKQYKIQWDKVTDDMVKGPDTKLDRKGIDMIVATKDVKLGPTSTYDWTTHVKKGQLLGVALKGKRVWMGRGIRTGQGSDRSFIGLDKRGYSNVRSLMNIDGAQVYHIDPAQKARGAGDIQAARAAAKAGASALITAKQTKEQNIQRYRKALQIKAGEAGKGAIVKMLGTATKMYEKALQEKLTKMKAGFIPRDSYYADTLKIVSSRYQYMVRAFEEFMRAGANIEAIKTKYKNQPDKIDSLEYSTSYEKNTMASKAKEVKDEFNKLKMELKKLVKATEYVDVNTLGRAY